MSGYETKAVRRSIKKREVRSILEAAEKAIYL